MCRKSLTAHVLGCLVWPTLHIIDLSPTQMQVLHIKKYLLMAVLDLLLHAR